MPPIPHCLPARARTRRVVAAAAGVFALASLGLSVPPTTAAAEGPRVIAAGNAIDHGAPAEALAGVASIPTGTGYWTVTPNGAVRPFGDAPDLGSPARAGTVDIAA